MRSRHQDVYRITTAQPGQTPEQRRREVVYLLMMGTRAVAIVVAVLVPGFWRYIAVVAGVLLPYMAVVMVNAVHSRDLEAQTDFDPTPSSALADTPFEGIIIPDDARDIDGD